MTASAAQAAIEISGDECRCTGAWTLQGIAGLERRLAAIDWPGGDVRLDASTIGMLDTSGALFLVKTVTNLHQPGRLVELRNLRPEHQALVDLVIEHRATDAGVAVAPTLNPLARLGRQICTQTNRLKAFVDFTGEAAIALGRTLLQRRRLRLHALFSVCESAGVDALPIIALMSFLIGVVIAYQGGEQLQVYGANIFIVELVCLTMLRELAPLLTAIMVAGRTGSAFTAQIGTMKVTEEIDALRTIGIDPMDILVLPKLLALLIVLPLLTIFADVLSIFGGMVIAQLLLGVHFSDFVKRIPEAVTLTSLMIGIGKAPVFAAIIALTGCYQGFQVSGSADSVGRQTTLSVVQSIFLVIIADAAFSVVLGSLGV